MKAGAARRDVARSRPFVKLVKWRTGAEARISCPKRDHGWRRGINDGLAGAQTWCAWGVLTLNAGKIAALVDADQPHRPARTGRNDTAPPPQCRTTTRPRHTTA